MADYISREEMHKANRDEWEGVYGHIDCDIFEDNENMIDRVPAADVRPVVRGEWIKKRCYAFCSNCGERIAITWTTTVEELVNVYRLKFCNNCGADMRKVVEIE